MPFFRHLSTAPASRSRLDPLHSAMSGVSGDLRLDRPTLAVPNTTPPTEIQAGPRPHTTFRWALDALPRARAEQLSTDTMTHPLIETQTIPVRSSDTDALASRPKGITAT